MTALTKRIANCHASVEAQRVRPFADRLPPAQFSCGNCGARFGTKAAKRKHKLTCSTAPVQASEPPEWNEDEYLVGRLRKFTAAEQAEIDNQWDDIPTYHDDIRKWMRGAPINLAIARGKGEL